MTVTNSLLYAGKINGPNVSVDTVTGFLRNSDVGILEVVNSPGFQLGPGLTYTGS